MTDSQRQPEPDGDISGDADARFAANMRARREELGMSLADVAREMTAAGVKRAPQTVHKDESGQRKIGVGEADAYARVLKTTITRLTQPDPASNTAAFIDMFTGRADSAWEQIASWTAALLFARDHIKRGIESAEKQGADAGRLADAVTEGRAALENATPEAALRAGYEDYARDHGDGS